MDRPIAFSYNDFRKFLEDWQSWRQSQDSTFSRTEFVRRLGLPRTRSFFTDLLRGKNLTPTFLERVVQVMDLPKEESQFFRALVKFNQADNGQERELYYEQLVALNRSPRAFLDPESFAYYKDWRNAALRNALDLLDWDGTNPAALGRRFKPRLTPGEVRKSFSVLQELSMVALTANGFWKPVHRVLSSGDGRTDEAVRQHQLQCLQLAGTALLEKLPVGERDTSTMFVTVSDEANALLRRRLEKFRAEIRSIVHKDTLPATRLLHIDLFLHPLIRTETP
jgi:uncharacterized protein (TIGR02147 family)